MISTSVCDYVTALSAGPQRSLLGHSFHHLMYAELPTILCGCHLPEVSANTTLTGACALVESAFAGHVFVFYPPSGQKQRRVPKDICGLGSSDV